MGELNTRSVLDHVSGLSKRGGEGSSGTSSVGLGTLQESLLMLGSFLTNVGVGSYLFDGLWCRLVEDGGGVAGSSGGSVGVGCGSVESVTAANGVTASGARNDTSEDDGGGTTSSDGVAVGSGSGGWGGVEWIGVGRTGRWDGCLFNRDLGNRRDGVGVSLSWRRDRRLLDGSTLGLCQSGWSDGSGGRSSRCGAGGARALGRCWCVGGGVDLMSVKI